MLLLVFNLFSVVDFCIRSKHTCEGARTREENKHAFVSVSSVCDRTKPPKSEQKTRQHRGFGRLPRGDFDAEKTIQPIFDRKKGRVPFGRVAGRALANAYPMFELPRKRFLRFVLASY